MDSSYIDLAIKLDGDLHVDELTRRLYATDASVYRKLPSAVVLPKSSNDLVHLVKYANEHTIGLIPRTAGTSLAGQCVGDGIVVDFSKYFTQIISFNESERTVTVQPGVVRDKLNNFLKPYGLFFGPNTSTSNRCMIGGMVGNNSSGTTSIKYGVTRDKVISLKAILSDGSEVIMNDKSKDEVEVLRQGKSIESRIYQIITKELGVEEIRNGIIKEFPKPEIHRRNNGYAIDTLISSDYFVNSGIPLNLSHLICGSEGTLAFVTEITLKLDQIPPENEVILALHFNSIKEALDSVSSVMTHDLYSCELLDDTILNLTKHNKNQELNRQFIKGEPKAILLCELRSKSPKNLDQQVNSLITSIQSINASYAQVVLRGMDITKAMELRKAGLGLLGNMIGDKKAVACIEDTAVAVKDLASYISEFTNLMATYNQKAVYYAHAGAGELHLRPILNLKSKGDVELFRKITTEVANLVKKYGGAMSGEHGDGIVRSEFIPQMIGKTNYDILKRVKQVFDPNNIFNPGKIIDPKPMDQDLRYEAGRREPEIDTLFDFSDSQGILREAEKCNGSGDCRKLPEFRGTMCPSYRATRNEKDTTRARANALREYLTNSNKPNKFDHEELKSVFDLCLSCKACSSECPSSVDVAALKAEFQYQYQKTNGVSMRTKLLARNNAINKKLSPISRLVNWSFNNVLTSNIIKKSMGIAKNRSLPKISSSSLFKYFETINKQPVSNDYLKTVYLFVDEFSNYLDTEIGKDALHLLEKLNYDIRILNNEESGRALISKGLLEEAKEVANKNIALYKDCVSGETPLIGIEPSAILSFKDEYLRLSDDKQSAKQIANHTFLIEEFLQKEIELGHISEDQFTKTTATIKYHGHCHQKALSNQKSSFDVLNLPRNYKVTIIPSGCCGMAGSFGYEKENYDISMSIGGQTLFPAINKSPEEVIIAANGTSCRHQILDGTGRYAKHPISILREALL
ncbi:FAD-binding and (Fe-S)-binding domain-containing protein [Winogradskyella aurantiaca]|uniref:FAD-binding and (Fe-S)-binding domain-containing protein n=1 Tax=Winogradskyella aurantiaca TaxID=2219558 RepID=UPI000E1CAA5B|nr:FAD-binding and (Fe-S)-binding domain-containing protein [Winogradskyella aurantiaca]